jgi:hypothetical protein
VLVDIEGLPPWCVEPIEGLAMERLHPYWFFKMGVYLGNLAELPSGITVVSHYRIVDHAKQALRTIIDGEGVPLPKSHKLAFDLMTTLVSAFIPPADRVIPDAVLENIAAQVRHLCSTIQAEVGDMDVFRVQQKGIFHTRLLIGRAEDNLSAIGRAGLTPEMKADIRAAGLCLGFEAFTAAGFHAFRALEAVARRYHAAVAGKQLDRETLGTILANLERIYESEPKPRDRDRRIGLVIGLLWKVKGDRDNIMHPELVLTEDRALSVFKVVCDAIDAMEGHRAEITGDRATVIHLPTRESNL